MLQTLLAQLTFVESPDEDIQRRGYILSLACSMCVLAVLGLQGVRAVALAVEGDWLLNSLEYVQALTFGAGWVMCRKGQVFWAAVLVSFGYPTALFVVCTWTSTPYFEPFILAVCLSPLIVGLTSKKWLIGAHFAWLIASLLGFHACRSAVVYDGTLFVPLLVASLTLSLGCLLFGWIYQGTMSAAIVELVAVQSQLEEATRSAKEADRAKSDFLAHMSHELRTPLNAIIGYSELITEELEDLDKSETHRRLLQDAAKINRSGRNLLALVNDILDLSKIEAGHMHVKATEFQLEDLIEEVCEMVSPAIKASHNVLLRDDRFPVGQTFLSDRLRIKQVLLNLLSNASKFTAQGQITLATTVHTHRQMSLLTMEVIDTGLGMDENALGQVFEEFVQAQKYTDHTHGGTGLGLPLCRRFCDLLGGWIEAESTPMVGSTFRFTLPALEDERLAS